MDLSKLTDEQLEIARKVAAEAEKQGLNPSFVLPMVMAESRFDPKAVSPKGAVGVMQLMPTTAESLKVDPADIDQNIEGGVRLLKQLVSNKNIGNDPHKVLMGYNAGPGTKFFQTGNLEDLPDETLNHITRVADIYGGNLPGVVTGAGEERQETVAPDQGPRIEPVGTEEVPGASEAIKPFLGIVGGGAGLGVATGLETTKKVAPLLPSILSTVAGQQTSPNVPVTRLSLQRYLNSQIAPNLRLPLRELERVTGGQKIRTMAEVQNALRAIQAVEEQRVPKPVVKMVPGRPGVYEQTGRFTTNVIPGRPGVDLTPYEMRPAGPMRAAVGRELVGAGEVARAVAPSMARIVGGGLGGAGAAMSGYDAYELARKIQKQREEGKEPSSADLARLATKSMATVGGGLSVLPFGVTQLGGLALSAPEMAWSLYDLLKTTDKSTPPPSGLPATDVMGNPVGSYQ